MGGAERYPSIAARHGDGFRSALPILRSIRFLPLLASLLSRPSMAIRTVAALRQSWPFRHGPVVLRFANRPRPTLLSVQFAFPGVAGSRPAQKARLRKGCIFAGQFRVRASKKTACTNVGTNPALAERSGYSLSTKVAMLVTLVAVLCNSQLCLEKVVTTSDQSGITMSACAVNAQIGIADWLAKGPYREWRLARYKCVLGKYVPKNEA